MAKFKWCIEIYEFNAKDELYKKFAKKQTDIDDDP